MDGARPQADRMEGIAGHIVEAVDRLHWLSLQQGQTALGPIPRLFGVLEQKIDCARGIAAVHQEGERGQSRAVAVVPHWWPRPGEREA